ncbi:hypothetical protein B0H11DRAFT_1922371 [Mycena galericulata]|nr:hypothetical protein B0H11DRAFT_1922371 [Mycena galericulata]
MSSSVTWPFSIVTQIHMSLPGEPSLFSPSQSIQAFVSGAGLSHVSIRFQDIQNSISFTMLSVDTLDADIDRTTRSWSISTSSWECPCQLAQLPIRIVLDFVTHKQFDCFLFALSYVRFIDGRSSLGIFSPSLGQARDIVVANTDGASSVETLSQHFVNMRGAPGDKCSVHTLPVELISLIFLHCTPFGCHRFETPLLLLRICSRWRIIAIQTPGLWRNPSFVVGLPYLGHRDNHSSQMALWLARAKSAAITLSLAVDEEEYLPHETFDLVRHNPSICHLVRTLHISSPQPQLCNLLGGADGPIISTLQSLCLVISRWSLGSWAVGDQFCRSAPLLRELKIEAGGIGGFVLAPLSDAGFITAFPWFQLTTLSLQMVLGTSTWIAVFSQCTSLQIGRFVLMNDRHHNPRVPVTFQHLESLRVTFWRFDSAFFEHLTLPSLQELHVSAFMDTERHYKTAFIPRFPALHTLNMDVVDLPQAVLEALVHSHSKLEQLSFFVDGDPERYAPMFQQLHRCYRLRTLTVSIGDDLQDWDEFPERATAWALQQVSATDCEFRLLGSKTILDAMIDALAQVGAVEATMKPNPDVDPFVITFYPRQRFLSVARREAATSPIISVEHST